MSLITDLADAITRQEGAGASVRYNNPGNLMDPNNRIWPEFPKASSGEVIFPDPATGRFALENDLSIKVNRGMTLASLLTMYAPPSQNDTATYIRNVSGWLGISSDVPLNTLSDTGPPYKPLKVHPQRG